MREPDRALSETERAAWNAIVECESQTLDPGHLRNFDLVDRSVTLSVPERPPIALLLVELLLLGVLVASFSVQVVSRVGADIHAATLRHQLSWLIPLGALLLALAVLITVRVGAFAAFLLRSRAIKDVCSGAPVPRPSVRPPNPVTLVVWLALVLVTSLAAVWCVRSGMEPGPALVGTFEVRPHVGDVLMAWLFTALGSWAGITVWVARESRHRVRLRSVCQPPVGP